MSMNEIFDNQKNAIKSSMEALKRDFLSLRSGKVSTKILDHVKVNYYETLTALSQVATVLATDATTITITPWEKSILKEIEKAIAEANLGVNPNNDGEAIKLFFPPMTVEQRKESAKAAKAMGEKAKISVRNARKDANNKIKQLEKDKDITEDDSKKAHDEIQKNTDIAIKNIDELVKAKEAELLKV